MISLNILLFSILKEKIESDSLTVTLNSPTTGKLLLDHLASEYPIINQYRRVIRLAVNESYVNESYEFSEGDIVALITPVSGG